VTPDYTPKTNQFTGRIAWVRIDVDDVAENESNLPGPEDRVRVAWPDSSGGPPWRTLKERVPLESSGRDRAFADASAAAVAMTAAAGGNGFVSGGEPAGVSEAVRRPGWLRV
jgi:hypothetical protein